MLRKAIEEAAPVIKEKEVFVQDTKQIESLTAEVDNLKALLRSEKQNSEDLGLKYSESEERSEERCKLLEETEKKVDQLQQSLRGYCSILNEFLNFILITIGSRNSSILASL